jgi:hypothetical protein
MNGRHLSTLALALGAAGNACGESDSKSKSADGLERIDCTALGFTGCDLEAGYGCVPRPKTELTP